MRSLMLRYQHKWLWRGLNWFDITIHCNISDQFSLIYSLSKRSYSEGCNFTSINPVGHFLLYMNVSKSIDTHQMVWEHLSLVSRGTYEIVSSADWSPYHWSTVSKDNDCCSHPAIEHSLTIFFFRHVGIHFLGFLANNSYRKFRWFFISLVRYFLHMCHSVDKKKLSTEQDRGCVI